MNTSTIDQIFTQRFSSIGKGVRHEQRVVIEALLDGHNTLSIMPTGGGKSLCYWIAGLVLKGTTLAIFPLTALMDEQARKLRSHGLSVVNLHSGISSQKQYQQLIDLRKGPMPDFIFASPERIGNDGFLEFILRERRDKIKLVVIDEIHCISQWGHDFRPFYQEIPPFLNTVFGDHTSWPRILGLTATLNQKDTEQVCQDFHITSKHVYKSQYLLRYPIDIRVTKVKDEIEKDGLFWEKLSQHKNEKVLVYIDNRKSGDRSTEGFCEKALQEGFKAAFFHGSMTSDQKTEVVEKYKSGEILTVFATSAFGMGIDIPDIRGVIHYRPPESIEQFYQQIGRVGRDGKPSWALIYYSKKNIDFRKTYFIDHSFPTLDEIKEAFKSLTSGKEPIQSFNFFEDENSQVAYHYLQRSELVRTVCKGVQKIDAFEIAPGVSLPEFERYKNATRTGITTLAAKKCSEPVSSLLQSIYRWWADEKIKITKSPQKCLMLEQLSTDLPETKLADIQSDIVEKKQYRYGLLDQLADVLESYKNSISLHQSIGQYLGVDKFQLDRVHQTISGEMVRSKSEVIIANQLTNNHIPFEYEKRLEAGGYGFWPDFTIEVGDQTYYWEHLGLLDLDQYRQNWAIKKAWYDQHFPGQLLITEEGSTVSQSAELVIKKHLIRSIDETKSALVDTEETENPSKNVVKVWTEGRTDWKHLKAAFSRLKSDGYFPNLEIQFNEIEEDMGDKELLSSCKAYSRDIHPTPIIFIFDRDVQENFSRIKDGETDYKDWGNGVYSVVLPVPTHRQNTPGICIEFCYQDNDLKQKDEFGRRLYTGIEFNSRNSIHSTEKIICMDRNKIGKFTIIDQYVFSLEQNTEENIALSKNQFARYILEKHSGFDNFDISGFLPLFQLIENIVVQKEQ